MENKNSKFIRLPEVIHRTGKSKTSIYADMELGTFPLPYRIGRRAVAWQDSEVEEWISSREKTLLTSSKAH